MSLSPAMDALAARIQPTVNKLIAAGLIDAALAVVAVHTEEAVIARHADRTWSMPTPDIIEAELITGTIPVFTDEPNTASLRLVPAFLVPGVPSIEANGRTA